MTLIFLDRKIGIKLYDTYMYELWPAQIRLGEVGVFSGKSAIVQMPTSSGKTKSMSIAIRVAFYLGELRCLLLHCLGRYVRR